MTSTPLLRSRFRSVVGALRAESGLAFLVMLTGIYLWAEVSFGVSLLDVMAGTVEINDTQHIEHWGRLISGTALYLVCLPWLLSFIQHQRWPWPVTLTAALVGLVLVQMFSWWLLAALLQLLVDTPLAKVFGTVAWWLVVPGLSLLCAALAFYLVDRFRGKGLAALIVLAPVGWVVITVVSQGITTALYRDATVHDTAWAAESLARQETATLTVFRRGLQQGVYSLPGYPIDPDLAGSPEGKAFFVLMPIFASVVFTPGDNTERDRLIREFHWRDWDALMGQTAFEGYQSIMVDLQARYDDYRANPRYALGGMPVPRGLSYAAFASSPAARKHIAQAAGCFDCALVPDMSREAFSRELHRGTKSIEVSQAIELFNDERKFRKGEASDKAARLYWAPFLALLFSMLGAMTHILKLTNKVASLAMRLRRRLATTGDHAEAAVQRDTRVVRFVTAGIAVLLVLLLIAVPNRVTVHPRYASQRAALFQAHPVMGPAAHITVKGQALLYPVAAAVGLPASAFGTDPLCYLPARWLATMGFEDALMSCD